MINIGFIGTGGMGTYQSMAFNEVKSCRIVAGADLSDKARARFKKSYPSTTTYANYHDLLRSDDVDGVVIAVPTGHHKSVAIDVLRAGKPVLCEKPMARTVAQCRQMIEAAKRYKGLLMIAHCRRYDPEWGAIAKVVQSGRLGSPILWRHVLAGVGPSRWFMDDKLGGGPLIDGAVHTYDYANYMFGKPDKVLSSSIKLNRKLTATDTGSAVVRYKSGNQLMISWSWAATSGGQQVFDLIGSRGGLSAGPGDLKTPKAEKGRYGYHTVHDLKGNRRLVKFRVHPRVGLMYINQAKHFLACMQGKAKCETPGNVAIGGVAVAEAILKAGKTGSVRKVTW